MRGSGFLLLSLVIGGAGIALYRARPLLDRWSHRLNAYIAAAEAQRHGSDGNADVAARPQRSSLEDELIGGARAQGLKGEIDAVLREGESTSDFVEAAVQGRIARRREESDLLARALMARSELAARAPSHPADEVHAKLEEEVDAGRRRLGSR